MRLILALAAATLTVACGRDLPPPAEPASVTPTADATTAPSAADAPLILETAIPADQIATRLELVGTPRYVASSDTLELVVRVHNDGQATLVGEGSAMVRLGAMLLGPEGPDKAPGVRDFIRVPLPLLRTGSDAEVAMSLPAQPMLDLVVRLELVQEGVNWFSAYGQPSLDVGPFQRCDGAKETLCDATGTALAE